MLVITISGKAEAGKDFTASIIKEILTEKGKKVLIVHYADYLKFIAKQYYDWDGTKSKEGRELLQKLGTNIIRKREPDFWVNIVCRLLSVLYEDYDIALIPDCRFPNEIDKMRMCFTDTLAVKVIRLNYENSLTPEQKLHPSEISLDDYPMDYVLEAESGREHVEEQVRIMLDEFSKAGLL